LEERTSAAMTSVMPMFSFLTLDQAMMALEMKKDNATEVIDWYMHHYLLHSALTHPNLFRVIGCYLQKKVK
jgi:hypothetical protein